MHASEVKVAQRAFVAGEIVVEGWLGMQHFRAAEEDDKDEKKGKEDEDVDEDDFV